MIITSSYITLCPISRIEYILLHLFLQLLPALLLGICNLSNLARGIRYNVCMLEISVHVRILYPWPMLKTFHEIAIKSYIFFQPKIANRSQHHTKNIHIDWNRRGCLKFLTSSLAPELIPRLDIGFNSRYQNLVSESDYPTPSTPPHNTDACR